MARCGRASASSRAPPAVAIPAHTPGGPGPPRTIGHPHRLLSAHGRTKGDSMYEKDHMPLSVAPFEQAGLHVQLDEFEALVMEAVARTLPRRPLVDARGDLTRDEACFLADAGVALESFAPPELGVRSPLLQT